MLLQRIYYPVSTPNTPTSDRSAKRLKLSTSKRHDQVPDLEKIHAECRTRLKTSFESIFEKFSYDFRGVSDEIHEKTGRIVANNGHLEGISALGDLGLGEVKTGGKDRSQWQEPDNCDSEDELLDGHKVRSLWLLPLRYILI